MPSSGKWLMPLQSGQVSNLCDMFACASQRIKTQEFDPKLNYLLILGCQTENY